VGRLNLFPRQMVKRTRERFSASAGQPWLALGTFLGIGMLPRPECGTPMIFHIWPVVGLVAVVQALKHRHPEKRPVDGHCQDTEGETEC